MNKFKVSISGSIGVGKTSVIDHFRTKDNYKTFKEDIDKEILDLFYQNRLTSDKVINIELLNQFHFLCETITREIKSYYSEEDILIYDRPIIEHSHVFAKQNLNARDWALLVGMQELFLERLGYQKYDLAIILDCDLETNLKRITGRGRQCELDTDTTYFKELLEEYQSDYFKGVLAEHSNKVIVIDTSNKTNEQVCAEIEQIIEEERNK
jgi:deoxyadenosine/deoxycytidine kinase